MAKVPKGIETLPKIQFNRLSIGRTNVRHKRQTTDGRATTYNERERNFTFAKNEYSNLRMSFLLTRVYRVRPRYYGLLCLSVWHSWSTPKELKVSKYFCTLSICDIIEWYVSSFLTANFVLVSWGIHHEWARQREIQPRRKQKVD